MPCRWCSRCWCFMICWSLVVGFLYVNLTSSWSFLLYPSLIGDPVEFIELPTNKANTSKETDLWIQPQRNTLVRNYAFYDDRDGRPSIVLNSMKDDHNRLRPQLQLKIMYNFSIYLCVPLRVWLKCDVYDPHKHNGQSHEMVNYLLRTTGSIHSVSPSCVSLTTDINCLRGLSENIPVFPHQYKKMLQFGVCLHQPLFNITDPQVLVDWIAIHISLGVEIVFVYLEKKFISEDITNPLNSFVKSGILELIDWSIGIDTYNYGQTAVINDCIYRSLHRVEYLAMYDIDEILVPRKHMTWSGMIQEIKETTDINQYASLSFSNYYWHDNGVAIKIDNFTMCQKMKLPIYLKRTEEMKTTIDYPPKLIIRPSVVHSCLVHYILNWSDSVFKQYSVDEKIATIHHYRKGHGGHLYKSSTSNTIMERYGRQSLKEIRNVMCSNISDYKDIQSW